MGLPLENASRSETWLEKLFGSSEDVELTRAICCQAYSLMSRVLDGTRHKAHQLSAKQELRSTVLRLSEGIWAVKFYMGLTRVLAREKANARKKAGRTKKAGNAVELPAFVFLMQLFCVYV